MDKEGDNSTIGTDKLCVEGPVELAGSTVSRKSLLDSSGTAQTNDGSSLHSVQTRAGGILGVSRMNRFRVRIVSHANLSIYGRRTTWQKMLDQSRATSPAMGSDAWVP